MGFKEPVQSAWCFIYYKEVALSNLAYGLEFYKIKNHLSTYTVDTSRDEL
jgi:hypothetical protein